jgi:phosphoribosyl 1,2-cyclic phosphodiesterase
MGLKLLSISSGSRGNCILVASDTTAVLIDVGIPLCHIKKGMELLGIKKPSVLITHTHTDHLGGLPVFSRAFSPDVFCHSSCYYGVERKMNGGVLTAFNTDFFVGDLTISAFKVSHDVPCVGYNIFHNGRKISVVTDIGKMTESVMQALRGSDILFLEANHDEQMLLSNAKYSRQLKERILSERGHLSNSNAAKTVLKLFESGTRYIMLGHLSEENNYPSLAKKTVTDLMRENGHEEEKDYFLSVAGFNTISTLYQAN